MDTERPGATSDGQRRQQWWRRAERPGTRRMPSAPIRGGAVVAVAVVIGVVVWLLVRGDEDSNPGRRTTTTALSEAGLATLAGVLSTPIFWEGPKPRTVYELTQTPTGRLFVRYLPANAKIGTSKPYPFVATFPMHNAFSVTTSVAARAGSVRVPIAGGVAFYSRASPENVYLAFRGLDYQIEVFDP